jgi:hypothetical protein
MERLSGEFEEEFTGCSVTALANAGVPTWNPRYADAMNTAVRAILDRNPVRRWHEGGLSLSLDLGARRRESMCIDLRTITDF